MVGQGRIVDRTREHLGESDRGVIMLRQRFLADLKVIAAGGDPKAILRDATRNDRIPLPRMGAADARVSRRSRWSRWRSRRGA